MASKFKYTATFSDGQVFKKNSKRPDLGFAFRVSWEGTGDHDYTGGFAGSRELAEKAAKGEVARLSKWFVVKSEIVESKREDI